MNQKVVYKAEQGKESFHSYRVIQQVNSSSALFSFERKKRRRQEALQSRKLPTLLTVFFL